MPDVIVQKKNFDIQYRGAAPLALNITAAPWLANVLKIYRISTGTALAVQSCGGGFNGATIGGAVTQMIPGLCYRIVVGVYNGWALPDSVLVDLITYGTVPANSAPTANAGADAVITLPLNSVTLQGSGTDPEGQSVTFSWTQLQGPNTATGLPSTAAAPTVSGLIAGAYVFRLTVSDGTATTVDTVNLTVNQANTAFSGALISIGWNSVIQDMGNNLAYNNGVLSARQNGALTAGMTTEDRALNLALKATDPRFEYNITGGYGKPWEQGDPAGTIQPEHFAQGFTTPAAQSAYTRRMAFFFEWINQFNLDYARGLDNATIASKQVQYAKNCITAALANGSHSDAFIITPTDILDTADPTRHIRYRQCMDLAVNELKAYYPANMFVNAWDNALIGKNGTGGQYAQVALPGGGFGDGLFRMQEAPIFHQAVRGMQVLSTLIYDFIADTLALPRLNDLTSVTATAGAASATLQGNSPLKLEYALYQGGIIKYGWQPLDKFYGVATGTYTPKARYYTRPNVVVTGADVSITGTAPVTRDPKLTAYINSLPAGATPIENEAKINDLAVYLRSKGWQDSGLFFRHPKLGHSPAQGAAGSTVDIAYDYFGSDGLKNTARAGQLIERTTDDGRGAFLDPNQNTTFSAPYSGTVFYIIRAQNTNIDGFWGLVYLGPVTNEQYGMYQQHSSQFVYTNGASSVAFPYFAGAYKDIFVQTGASGDRVIIDGLSQTTATGTTQHAILQLGQNPNNLSWGNGNRITFAFGLKGVTPTGTEQAELLALLKAI